MQLRLTKIPLLFLIVSLLIAPLAGKLFFVEEVSSQSSEEIGKQIEEEQKKLEETRQKINQLEEEIQNNKQELDSLEEGIPKLEAQMKEVELEISLNMERLNFLKQENELKKQEEELLRIRQKEAVKEAYVEWRSSNTNFDIFLNNRREELFAQGFSDKVFKNSKENLTNLQAQILGLSTQVEESTLEIEELNVYIEGLKVRKQQIEQQIAFYNQQINNSTASIGGLKTQEQELQKTISQLTEEQKAVAEREAWILEQQQNSRNNNDSLTIYKPEDPNGKFVFSGTGRDAYQGHGVGLSQFGSYGGANSGMSAEELIKFYYTGVELTQRTGNVSVIGGPQNINVEEYLVHIGEVPDKACGNEEQVNTNPEKYALKGESVWGCWPEEAIKAQIIIARTYALFHQNLYADARSQVYDTSHNKSWAQKETEGIVITYNGELIDAVYSSDNNQGKGTANNDTIFQTFEGNGTPYPYLRAVNDNSFAHTTQWTNWQYSTREYDFAAIIQMLDFIANNDNSGYNSSIRQKVSSILTSIGTIDSITFERDPSDRIKKVWLEGENGNRYSIGGWWFKNMWNTWSYESGYEDYIYSQTFYLVAV